MALNLNEKKIPFGGQLGGTGLLIILLVVSLVLVIVYSREETKALCIHCKILHQRFLRPCLLQGLLPVRLLPLLQLRWKTLRPMVKP